MAKAQKLNITVNSREEADLTLKKITALTLLIEAEERDAQTAIDAIRSRLLRETSGPREALALYEKALRTWAKTDRKNWDGKSVELNFGTVGFRLPKAAIKLKLAVENIIERLRAKKMHTCIRIIEEVDKEALANYEDEVLLDVGCERTKPKDKFYYEIKREEVK
ncbi:MAG TPA: host-nuclease inhibitor Gam family protein [Candidatus Acidoferrales bacterium]|nr:host-nuclease inhibitor Gam family protein [Candidatus Acidoferrales bacterium]